MSSYDVSENGMEKRFGYLILAFIFVGLLCIISW